MTILFNLPGSVEQRDEEFLANYSDGLTDLSLPRIGAEFGGKDHSTVIHANAKITAMPGKDREVLVKPALMNWEKTDIRFDQWGNVKGWTVKDGILIYDGPEVPEAERGRIARVHERGAALGALGEDGQVVHPAVVRADVAPADDELGQLAATINEMLERLQGLGPYGAYRAEYPELVAGLVAAFLTPLYTFRVFFVAFPERPGGRRDDPAFWRRRFVELAETRLRRDLRARIEADPSLGSTIEAVRAGRVPLAEALAELTRAFHEGELRRR